MGKKMTGLITAVAATLLLAQANAIPHREPTVAYFDPDDVVCGPGWNADCLMIVPGAWDEPQGPLVKADAADAKSCASYYAFSAATGQTLDDIDTYCYERGLRPLLVIDPYRLGDHANR